ncbi:MAG TPA: glycosyltransferase [Terracidiphilus sp.]|nr:glycosyltransferase [Terracidiphilus sp.]
MREIHSSASPESDNSLAEIEDLVAQLSREVGRSTRTPQLVSSETQNPAPEEDCLTSQQEAISLHESVPRVLHVVENLNRGAVENWLVRMLRHAHSKGIRLNWTFYCALPRPGELDEEAVALGARVLYSPVAIGNKWTFARALRAELKRRKYDVLHCHHDLVSAFYLLAATGLPLSRRIVHVHNADEHVLTPSKLKQSLIRGPMRRVCLKTADRIVGISGHTLDTFLAGRPRYPGRDVVHYYGIEPPPVRGENVDPGAFRRSLNLDEDSRILLFAGRIVPEKNPLFALDVLAEMIHLDSKVAGVFVGSGQLEASLATRATKLGLQSKFRSLGWRADVPEIMRCCDWFILPRPEQPMEGFGIAVVEAELAGLRLLLSRGIADDPLLPTARVQRLSLGAGAEAWAHAAIALYQEPAPSRSNALAALKVSPMDMDRALADLIQLHA